MAIFHGETFDESLDKKRLALQLLRVFELMKDSQWRTLQQIADTIHAPTQSVGARLRQLREERCGLHTVNRRRKGEGRLGLFEYRLIVNPKW